MASWRALFSPCLFFHAEPIKEMKGKTFQWTCPRCCQVLGTPLKGQKFKARKSATVVTFKRKARSA